MKKKLVLAGIGIIVIIIASTGWYLYNKPHSGVSNIDADVKITAGDLFRDYQNDEATANKKYLNKVIEVTGNIADIQNVNGSQIILLSTKDEMGGVNCQLSNSEKDKDITLKKSTTITIKGRCSGYLMDVNLVDCILK